MHSSLCLVGAATETQLTQGTETPLLGLQARLCVVTYANKMPTQCMKWFSGFRRRYSLAECCHGALNLYRMAITVEASKTCKTQHTEHVHVAMATQLHGLTPTFKLNCDTKRFF